MPHEKKGASTLRHHPETGYEYREYKNWRGIPKPRRCPFCKSAKGVIRKGDGWISGSMPELRGEWAEAREL